MYRFVKEKCAEEIREKQKPHTIAIDSGEIARKTYETIIQTPSTSTTKNRNVKIESKRKTRVVHKKAAIPYEKNHLFRAATSGDMETIKQMNLNKRNVNITDQFGWSALMMASYEGHLDVVKLLIRIGAKLDIESPKKDTAIRLAENGKHHDVVKYFKQINAPSEAICLSSDEDNNDVEKTKETHTFTCDICNTECLKKDRQSHIASTIHRFNRTDLQQSSRHFGIPESNVGFQMLLQQGWDRESGLGPNQNGVIYPIKTTLRKPRSGLGTQQPTKSKVTHFKPFDSSAVKSIKPPLIRNVTTKRQIRAEKLRTQRKDRYLRKLLS